MNYYIITYMHGKDRLIVGEFADNTTEFLKKVHPKPTNTYIIKRIPSLSVQGG